MLRIGEFAKLSRVSIRMLHYYDEIGVLAPAHVDPNTGYRLYSAQQLPRLNRILALQDLGFSLDQISELLQEDLPIVRLQAMLRERQDALNEQVRQSQDRLLRVAARLAQIEGERQASPYDVMLKPVGPQLVASVRGVIGGHAAIGDLFGALLPPLMQSGVAGLAAAIWHDDISDERRIDAEAIAFLRAPLAPAAPVRVYELPAATMASVVHHGPLLALNQAYEAVVAWIEAQGYEIAGPNRELYLHYVLPARPDDASYVTELQFPVQR